MGEPPVQRGSIIEFCGLPGAGKSALAHTLLDKLGGRGHTVRVATSSISPAVSATRRIAVKAGLVLTETLEHPLATAAGIAAVTRSDQPSKADLLRRSLQWFVTQRLLRAAQRGAGVHIFDEGALQALWSIGLRGNLTPVLHAVGRSSVWVVPDLVVVVDAPLDVVRDRLTARRSRHARSQSLDTVRQRAELERGKRLLDELVEWWCTNNDADRLVRVRHDADVTLSLTELVSRAASALPEPPDSA